MKLHELGIGDDGARARGDREPKAGGLRRVGRHGIEMTDAAGRQHDRAGSNDHGRGERVLRGADLQAGDRAVFGQQVFRDKALEQADRRRLAHGVGEGGHDRCTRHIAADMDDAAGGMRGLAADGEPAFEVAVERNAIAQQIVDPCGRLACETKRHALVDQAGADRDRVGRMRLGTVAFADRRGDAALRPGRRCALPERRRGNHGDRPRREFQRAEQSGEAAADNDDFAVEKIVCLPCSPPLSCFRLIIRSTERRALSAIAGSTVTSSRR